MVSTRNNPHATLILGVAIFCAALSTLSFALRIWARRLSAFDFWYDDLLMALAMVFNIYLTCSHKPSVNNCAALLKSLR